MNQYNSVNVKLCNSQLNKSKLGIENGAEVTLNLSSNVASDSDGETNCSHRSLLTERNSRLCKDWKQMIYQLI